MNFNYADYVPLLKALADETRIKIIHLLSKSELCACDLLEQVSIGQPTLSYHMKILSECELVHAKKVGVWMHYRINKDVIIKIETLMREISESEPTLCCVNEFY